MIDLPPAGAYPAVRTSLRIRAAIDRLDSRTVAGAVVVMAVFLWLLLIPIPYRWTGNEENYFLLAYQAVRPTAFGPHSAVFDQSSGKFVALWMFGSLIAMFGYAAAHLLLLLVSTLLIAYALHRVARLFELSLLDLLAVTSLFCLFGQSLMGSEWFLGGIETKAFAYGFALLSLVDASEQRPLRAAVFSVGAIYAHFLVGGFWFGASLVLFLSSDGSWRRGLAMVALTLALTAPLEWGLIHDQLRFAGTPHPAGMPTANYIYSIIRVPHHAEPFAAKHNWWHALARGLGAALLIALVAVRARRSDIPRALRALAVLEILLCVYLFVIAGLSWFDRDTGALGKFYLFRPTSLMLLLALVMLFAFWRRRYPRFGSARRAVSVIALIVFLILAPLGRLNQEDPALEPSERGMIAAVRERTSPGDPILVDPTIKGDAELPRALDRQTIVSWKFNPTAAPDIYRWWRLLQNRSNAFGGDCGAIEPYVRYVIATAPSTRSIARCGSVVWANRDYSLIRIR